MPRKARKKSESGIYHIIMRGINRQIIFEEEEDFVKFLQTIQDYKKKCGYEIYSYCLMGNHVHLLLRIGEEPLEQVMRRICGSYVYWYNWKYQRVGNLFQDRFKSETVEDDAYLLTVQRYIHQNPIKAGLVKKVSQYTWSSFKEYTNKTKLVNVNYILNILNNDREKALKKFIQYNDEMNKDLCLEIEEKHRKTDEKARDVIKKLCKVQKVSEL